MIEEAVKAEPEDVSSLYDLEYRASEDDAWYSVHVVLDDGAEALTVKYWCLPEKYEVVFSAAGFETEADVDELVTRFRPISRQVQDHQCQSLSIGAKVCAAHGTADDDLRFYDAVIDAVDRHAHSFADGDECLCNFVLYWKHGRGRGTLTSANIASICTVEPAFKVDPRISAFAIIAKKKVASSKSVSTRKRKHASIGKNSESSLDKPLKMDTSMMLRSPASKSEDSGEIRIHNEWTSQDEDMGPNLCNTNGLATACDHHFILINNLEIGLTPSSIEDFIFKQTTILPQAFVFPRLLSDPFLRGAIIVDSQKKVQIIHEFLENPSRLVVSSSGRPWIITEKASTGTFGAFVWNLIPRALDEIKSKSIDGITKLTSEELQVVLSGTQSYERAKKLRDLFIEYIHHESQLCKKLILEEKKIMRSCQQA